MLGARCHDATVRTLVEGDEMSFLRIAAVSFFVSLSAVNAQLPELPHAMASLGDSMTEALMSDFSIEQPPNLIQVVSLISGASLKERIPYFRKHFARPQHSWAAGGDDADIVISHLEHLKKYAPNLTVTNYSVSGAKTSDLADQVDALLQDEYKSSHTYDYITLLMGANDLASVEVDDLVSPITYERNLENQFRRILSADAKRRLLLVGLPPIFEIFDTSAEFQAYKFWNKTYSCSEMRKMVYGPLVVFMPENQEAYEQVKVLARLYDSALQNVKVNLSRDYPEAEIKVASGYRGGRTTRKTLSIDCFHPSVWGQARMAEATWALGFWPSLK